MNDNNLQLSQSLQPKSNKAWELLDVDNLENQTIEQFKEQKNKLAAMRQQVSFYVDGKKLEQSLKVIDAMDGILDQIVDPLTEPKEKGTLTRALRDMTAVLSSLSRLDTIDGYGTAKRITIDLENWQV